MSTCVECKFFTPIMHMPDGICTKGHGWVMATIHGLPKPKEGTGYVLWFNTACETDFCIEN